MKKIFTLISAAAVAMSAAAANFNLYFDGEPVTDGAEYKIGYIAYGEPDEWEGKVYQSYMQSSELCIKGDEGTAITLDIVAGDNVTKSNQLLYCWPDACESLPKRDGSMTATRNGMLNGEMEDLEIHGKVQDGIDGAAPTFKGDITVTVTATADGTDESVTCTVTMLQVPKGHEDEASIISAGVDRAYVKVMPGNVLSYKVDSPCTLSIYAITGNNVAKYAIANAGSINISNLPKGIYIYTDGTHSGKILVR